MKISALLTKLNILYGIVLVLVFTFSNCPKILAQDSADEWLNHYQGAHFAPGTFFKGVLQNRISSGINRVNDVVRVINPFDISIENTTCIPANSIFIGEIADLQKAQEGQNGKLQIIFNSIRLPNGQEVSMTGHLWSKKGRGIVGGDFTKRTGYKKMPHHIEGLGSVIQILPNGLREMGQETELLPGLEIIIVLDKELRINIPEE